MTLDSNKITVGGKESALDTPAQMIEGRTMIPLRAMVEALGKKVFWDDRGLIIISDKDNIFDAETEKYYIDSVLRKIKVN